MAACLVARYPMVIRQQPTTGGWIHFWFADPGHGPLGLRLLRQVSGNLPFLGGAAIEIAAATTMRQLYRDMLWFDLERLFCPLDPGLTARLSLSRNDDTLRFLRALSISAGGPLADLAEIDRFGDDYDAVWSDMRIGFAITTDRTSRFMNWRYVDHPRLSYRRVACRAASGTVFYVWREEVTQGPVAATVARLCEVVGSPDAIRDTLTTCLRHMAARNLAFVDFFCSSSTVVQGLIAGGMRPVVSRPGFDLPHRLRPVESYVNKRLDFYYMFPSGSMRADHSDFRQCYFTRGDSNQDIPPRPMG